MDDSADVTNWIRLSRKLTRSEWWLADPFSRGQAWVDLLMLANWKDGFVRVHGVRVDLKRGQLCASSTWLSARWKWSRGKVTRFLNELEMDQRIGQLKTHVTTVVTITNYDRYQKTDSKQDNRRTTDDTTDDTTGGQPMIQPADTQEESKEGEEGKSVSKVEEKSSSESAVAAAEPVTEFVFPIVGKGAKEWALPSKTFDVFVSSYPGVDVAAECRKAMAWCFANPQKRKTPTGMPKFLNSWMARQQNNGSGGNGQSPTQATEEPPQRVVSEAVERQRVIEMRKRTGKVF